MELLSFLEDKPTEATVQWKSLNAPGDALVTVTGFADESWGEHKGEFIVTAKGVLETQLNTAGSEPVTLAASNSHPLLWDYGGFSSIFGNAPLPDPPRFFHEFYQLVRSDLGVPRDPVCYLNWNEHLGQWLEFVYSRTYQLLSAPAPVAEAATELLEVQAAEYTILADPPKDDTASYDSLLAIVLGDSWLICQSAEISF